jgi:hypothetical protein
MTRPVPLRPEQPLPWVVPDLFRWFGLLLLSGAGLVVAWWGVSGTARVSGQVAWVNVGVAALVVGGLGNMTWLLQGRRALAIRRRALLAEVQVTVAPADVYPNEPTERPGVRVAVAGTTRHHRPDCPAVAGKKVQLVSLAAHERAGRRPCGLCSR